MKRKKAVDPAQLELALDEAVGPVRAGEPAAAQPPPAPLPAAAPPSASPDPAPPEPDALPQEPRLWRDAGWTARVVRNEQGDCGAEGWAVEMTKDGEAEPALVGPWTMGRDKKNPKPLDAPAFAALVKAAAEVRRRHEQQWHALLHQSVTVVAGAATVTVTLDVVPDEHDAYATLAAFDAAGARLAQVRVAPGFRLSKASAAAWVASGFQRP